jgi:uncharacterized protein (DUF1800 family)
MQITRRNFLKAAGATTVLVGMSSPSFTWFAQAQQQAVTLAGGDPLLHLLNRLTWGPRPQDLARAAVIGYEAYLEEQLNPEVIDDAAMDERLQREHTILLMSRDDAYALTDNTYRTYLALTKGMIARAVHSERQLFERVVEFWTDHFNIPSDELGPELVVFQREAIRHHALGNFRDMLLATAQSPAMLYYLDNYLNVAEHPNENYARELMELHTLGVDGGYTENDVYEVARAFTGWTVREGTDSGFYFDSSVHDTGEKVVLGHTLPAERGVEDALHVISILAQHPSTAQYICYKLCVRFVSDNPPQSLVDSAAALWIESEGNIRVVLRHIFLSEEFRQSAGQKLRRPLDFFVGALRATGTEFREYYVMETMLLELAQPPFGWQPPNGYPDVAGAWINSGGLLARWNTALALTHGAFSEPDSQMIAHLIELIGEPTTVGELVDEVACQVFAVPLPESLRDAYVAFASDDGGAETPVTPHLLARKLGMLFGLMLASPLYQWR